ncbi:hypothetical protein [Spongiimicrobium sp. 3-5]|uniref:hypothetical protein n=1 Tax=Spongiimicrobium sp. 3-5 TaxID=3332596 RepID=UPI003981421C
MKRKLKEELTRLSTDIITSRGMKDIDSLYEAAKALYEKLAVLKYIDEKLNDIEIDVSKNAVAAKFEKMANAVMDANTSVPENNPHDEDIITPGIDTIKDMVSEMPTAAEAEKVFAEFIAKPDLMKNDMEQTAPDTLNGTNESVKGKSLNDSAVNDISVGLNDRLAFVKHLFNDSSEDYNRVISQLNTIDTQERSVAFVENMVKPDYNNWQGKEAYELRFMALIARKFS